MSAHTCPAGAGRGRPSGPLCPSRLVPVRTQLPASPGWPLGFWEHPLSPPIHEGDTTGARAGPWGRAGRAGAGRGRGPSPLTCARPRPGPSSTWRLTTGSASSHPPSASRAPRTWPPSWARWPRWAASTSPTRSRPCRVSSWPCSPSCALAGALDCPGRGCAWEAVYQLPAPTPGMLLFFKPVATHGGVCHAIQSLGSAFPGFPTGQALPPEATAVSGADPGECAHLPARWGETFLAPPIPPDFSLLGIISKSLRLFFKKKRERKQRIDRCHVKC